MGLCAAFLENALSLLWRSATISVLCVDFMCAHASSRLYSATALERWFANVGFNWEASFDREARRRGREIYRAGQIASIELTEEDAIVHCSFTRKDTCYVVLEWDAKRGPKVRCSDEDVAMGQAVAVAGMYEIEELIADEIAPLPFLSKKNAENTGEASEKVAGGDVSRSNAEAPAADTLAEKVPERVSRRLLPRLMGGRSGLRLVADWKKNGAVRSAAALEDEIPLTSEEREALVRLTGKAREAGFVFQRDSNDFLLAEADRIGPFFSHRLKHWKADFGKIDLDLEARLMAEGAKEIHLVGRAKSSGRAEMNLDWCIRLGRRWLEPEDVERLARAGKGTHIIKGLGLVRIREDQTAALSEWQVGMPSANAQTWPRYMVFSLFAQRGAELDLESLLKDWRKSVMNKAPASWGGGASPKLPDFLRSYQAEGVRWLENLSRHACHGLLADEMGLGKTLQILTLLWHYPIRGKDSLIVCPASVVPVWLSEVKRWYPELKTAVLRSGTTFSDCGECGGRIWVASYTQLRRHKSLLERMHFGYAVLDEAQQIKNPDAKVTQACCAIRADFRVALTGTPVENRLVDLWTLFRFLMPGLLGSRRRFEALVTDTDAEIRAAAQKRLRQQIAPFVLRRDKDTVGQDLPPKVEMDLICPITDLQRQVYDGLLARGREEMGEDLQAILPNQAINFFTLLTRLRQACCDPGLIPGVQANLGQSGKVQMLLTRLSEALEGDANRKIVIFSQFVQLLKRLKPLIRRHFPRLALFELTGSTKERAQPVEDFQKNKGPAVIFVSMRAGGTGITLHAADYVFLLDPWWNPAVENQAVDRVHRIGQTRRVFVYRMITEGTIEARIQDLKTEKRLLSDKVLSGIGGAADLQAHFSDLQALAKLLR